MFSENKFSQSEFSANTNENFPRANFAAGPDLAKRPEYYAKIKSLYSELEQETH